MEKPISDAIVTALSVVESTQNIRINHDEYKQLAMVTWDLVRLIAENQNKGKVSEQQYRDLSKVLEDIQKEVFSKSNAAQFLQGQATQDSDLDTVEGLREKLLRFPKQFDMSQRHRTVDGHSDYWLVGTGKPAAIGNNANLSQSKGDAPGPNNTVTDTFTNDGLIAANNGSNNSNMNLQGNSNEVYAGSDYRQYHGPININNQVYSPKYDEILGGLRRAPAQYSSLKWAGGCIPGTRTSVLKQIMAWAAGLDPGDPPIFWLYGPAGTGKSTIAYSVAEQCSELVDHLSASFFFNHADTDCSDANLLFSTIAYQLANLDPKLKAHIANHVKKHDKPEDIRLEVQFLDLIIRPLSELGSRISIVIIIDALDECSNARSASNILRLLSTRVSNLPFRLKFFITSRPEPHIRAKMESNPRSVVRFLNISRDVDPSSAEADIRLFLLDSLREGGWHVYGGPTSWLQENDIDALAYQSGGLFIYASSVVEAILDNKDRYPRVRVTELLGTIELGAVNAIYLRAMRGALPENAHEALEKILWLVLGAIIIVKETLSPRTLEALLGLETGTVRRVLSGLHSVMAIPDNEDDGVRVIHPSFPHYLTNKKSFTDADSTYFIDLSIHNALFAGRCFRLMKASLKKNICGFSDFSRIEIAKENKEQSEFISRNISDAVKYSCRHFLAHICASDFQDSSHDEMLIGWARQHLLQWMEVLILLGSFSVVLPSLNLLTERLKERIKMHGMDATLKVVPNLSAPILGDPPSLPGPQQESAREAQIQVEAIQSVKRLAWDASLMVVKFSDTIQHTPWSVHTSGVMFAPTTSELYKYYGEFRCIYGNREIWNANTALHRFGQATQGLAFSSNGWVLASLHRDGTIYLRNLGTGELRNISSEARIATEENENNEFITFSPGDKYIAVKDQIYDVATGKKVLGQADCIAFSPDGKYIALSSNDGSINLYESHNRARLSRLSGHSYPITSMEFSPNAKWLSSTSSDNTLCIWSGENFKGVLRLPRKESMEHPHSVSFSPDGAYLAFCDGDQMRVWVMAERTELVPSHAWDGIRSFQKPVFSPDSKSIAWVTHQGEIIAIQLGMLDVEPTRYQSSGYCSVAFSSSGKAILAGNKEGGIHILYPEIEGEQASKEEHADRGVVKGIISSPQSGYYASWSSINGRGSIYVWEGDDEAPPARATEVSDWDVIYLATFSPDGQSIAVVCGKADFYVGKLDAVTGRHLFLFKLSCFPHSIEFSPGGKYLSTSYELWLWDTGRPVELNPNPDSGGMSGCTFSSDAAYIALCYDERKLFVVSLEQHSRQTALESTGEMSPSTLQFSPDCRHVAAVALESKCIVVWEVATGKLLAQAQAKVANKEFSFSTDGRHIAYLGKKGVYAWDFLEGGSEGKIVYRDPVHRMSFSPLNPKYLAAVIKDKRNLRAVLIDIDTQEKVSETTEISSHSAFIRYFKRGGRFPSYAPSDQATQSEDDRNFPYSIELKEGWIRTATSRPLCRLPKPYRVSSRNGVYDTNGNRIVIVSDTKKMILIQFGAEPDYEDHMPFKVGALWWVPRV